jgi:hypothetical protein
VYEPRLPRPIIQSTASGAPSTLVLHPQDTAATGGKLIPLTPRGGDVVDVGHVDVRLTTAEQDPIRHS